MTPRDWHYIPGQRWRLWRDDSAPIGGAVFRATTAAGANVSFRLTAADLADACRFHDKPTQRQIAMRVIRREYDALARFFN